MKSLPQNVSVLVMSDNITTVSVINKNRLEQPGHSCSGNLPVQVNLKEVSAHNIPSHSRPIKCRRRSVVLRGASRDGVGTLPSQLSGLRRSSRIAQNRPFCLSNKTQTPEIRVPVPTSKNNRRRLLHNQLEPVQQHIYVYSYKHSVEGNSKASPTQRTRNERRTNERKKASILPVELQVLQIVQNRIEYSSQENLVRWIGLRF